MTRSVWLSSLALMTAVLGCSNQGEGERCSLDNFNSDCESGLICQALSGGGVGAICCPEENATVAACREASDFEVDEDFSEVTTTGTVDASASETADSDPTENASDAATAADPSAPDAAMSVEAAETPDAGKTDSGS